MNFEQTSEKKFNRVVGNSDAKCTSPNGMSRYSVYYDEHGNPVARIDHSLNVFEIISKQEIYK